VARHSLGSSGLLELATFVTLRPTNYHLFIRQRKKMNPPEIKARMASQPLPRKRQGHVH
jgi:hypothetical protein